MVTKRELVKRDSGYGCKACGWLFMPAGFQKTTSPNISVSTAIQLEFNAHECIAYLNHLPSVPHSDPDASS